MSYTDKAIATLADCVSAMSQARNAGQAMTPFRISNAAQCTRKMAYQAVCPHLAEEDGPRLILGRMFGDEVHDMIRDCLYPVLTDVEKRVEFSFTVDDEAYNIGGHIDGILILPGEEPRLLEIKSISDIGFDLLQYAEGDKYQHIEETYRASHAAYRKALGMTKSVFLFVNKNTSHTLWVEAPEADDELALSVAVSRWYTVSCWLRTRTDEAAPPEQMRDHNPMAETKRKKPTGRTVLPWNCSYCRFVRACWPKARLDLETGKPVYVV